MNDFETRRFYELIKQISKGVIDGEVMGGFTRATLISLSPLTFQVTAQLKIYGSFLVTPKYRIFTEKDIGKEFVFFKDLGGQTYYYAYEPQSPQGANGEEYVFSGEMECTLRGQCPTGEVVVTGGEIKRLTHRGKV